MGKALRMDSWEIVSGVVIPKLSKGNFGTENSIIVKQIANNCNKFVSFSFLCSGVSFLFGTNNNKNVFYF